MRNLCHVMQDSSVLCLKETKSTSADNGELYTDSRRKYHPEIQCYWNINLLSCMLSTCSSCLNLVQKISS